MKYCMAVSYYWCLQHHVGVKLLHVSASMSWRTVLSSTQAKTGCGGVLSDACVTVTALGNSTGLARLIALAAESGDGLSHAC